MKKCALWIVIIGLAMIFFAEGYFIEKHKAHKRENMIHSAESEIFHLIDAHHLNDELKKTIANPSEKQFGELYYAWEATQRSLKAMLTLNKEQINDETYEAFKKYKYNQVSAMFNTYADRELKTFERERLSDLKAIQQAWEEFLPYIEHNVLMRDIQKPQMVADGYIRFLKQIRIDWP